jgi:hypothetical protein
MTIDGLINEISSATTIEKKKISAQRALNEAFDYERPSSFSRGLRLNFGNVAGWFKRWFA